MESITCWFLEENFFSDEFFDNFFRISCFVAWYSFREVFDVGVLSSNISVSEKFSEYDCLEFTHMFSTSMIDLYTFVHESERSNCEKYINKLA